MSDIRLECRSSYGDQTLSKIRFALHGSSNATEAVSILDEGLRFIEGRPLLSTNLIHALDWTINPAKQAQSRGTGAVLGEPGSVVLLAIPPNLHLGYGMFTTAYVDRVSKRVDGNPLKYAGGRKQLGLYQQVDTEVARKQLEAVVANGYTLDQRPQLLMDPQYILGSLDFAPETQNLFAQIDVAARELRPLDFGRIEAALHELIVPRSTVDPAMIAAAAREVMLGTVESVVISRLRMMRWQGLALAGFAFYEGKQTVSIAPVKDKTEQRRRMDEVGLQAKDSALLGGELSWLKDYVAHELEVMRLELEAAELEALPD